MKRLAALLAFFCLPSWAADLLTDPPYGVDLTALVAPLWTNPSIADIRTKTVSLTAINGTSISVAIPYQAPFVFTGSKVTGNALKPDVWTGTDPATGAKMVLRRDGQLLTGDINVGTGLQAMKYQVVRFNSTGAGAFLTWKGVEQRTHFKLDEEYHP